MGQRIGPHALAPPKRVASKVTWSVERPDISWLAVARRRHGSMPFDRAFENLHAPNGSGFDLGESTDIRVRRSWARRRAGGGGRPAVPGGRETELSGQGGPLVGSGQLSAGIP